MDVVFGAGDRCVQVRGGVQHLRAPEKGTMSRESAAFPALSEEVEEL